MNIVERAKQFAQSLRELAGRGVWEWKKCPKCGSMNTIKNGGYSRHPWTLAGRQVVRIQRHLCYECKKSYSEQKAWLVRGSWYAREVHRSGVDLWLHLGTSERRAAEWLRSWMGKQERYLQWDSLAAAPAEEEKCHLSASTINRWLEAAGVAAEETVVGQLEGVEQSTAVGVDGLWARLQGGEKRVVLAIVDTISGLIWPPVVQAGEEAQKAWGAMFARAQKAGMASKRLRGVTSDGAKGLVGYLRRQMSWVRQQRCLFHIRLNLHSKVKAAATAAAHGLADEAAKQVQQEMTKTLNTLINAVLYAKTYAEAEAALATLQGHAFASVIAQFLNEQFDSLLVYTLDYYQDIATVNPEWIWRDFRLRLSRGRNHGSDQRLEQAALVWAIYHNFTPHQFRSEHKRHYRHPGLCPLEAAGLPPPPHISYLDALAV